MSSFTISYRIKFSEKLTEVFDFILDSHSGRLISEAIANPPRWTELDYRQCSHCPLSLTEHPHCPVALQLYHIIERFHDTSSIDEVELEVVTEDRRVIQRVSLQRAIGSMLGLVSPASGCPKTAYLKPMTRFHLPLSSEEDTIFRVTGTYLLAQFFLKQAAQDLSGLASIYQDLHILNKAIASRLKGATESDSSKNAIVLLDMYSSLVPMMIDDHLPEIKGLFDAYFPGGKIPEAVTKIAPKQVTLAELKKKSVSAIGDQEIDDLLNQEDFVSEMESLLGSDKKSS